MRGRRARAHGHADGSWSGDARKDVPLGGAQVATPANWKDGDDVVIVPSITDAAEIAEKFPKGHTELKPYLRMTPQPDVD